MSIHAWPPLHCRICRAVTTRLLDFAGKPKRLASRKARRSPRAATGPIPERPNAEKANSRTSLGRRAFACAMQLDVTLKGHPRRNLNELCLYTVKTADPLRAVYLPLRRLAETAGDRKPSCAAAPDKRRVHEKRIGRRARGYDNRACSHASRSLSFRRAAPLWKQFASDKRRQLSRN